MNCGACHEKNIDSSHQCIESKYLLQIRHWLLDGLEDTGHDLGHYFTSLQRNTPKIRKYAHAVAHDAESTYRAGIHLDVCNILGVERKDFKPFESEKIWDLPSKDEAIIILWDAIIDFMWTYTNTYRIYNKTYRESLELRKRYFNI